MITVHLILNAHIDPVWLWPWQAGLDEVLATCRSACERLDAHPDIVFTRGEAWAYDVVERADPALFARIRAHVAAGRWEITGGWWIQPDCNLPSRLGLERQIELGRDYFRSRFGMFPRVAFNVDSFGHAAALPGVMRRFGQDRYVMMRPQEHEKALPARLFRWRVAPGSGSGEGEDEVTTFRIAREYSTGEITADHLLASLEDLPDGVSHTMCFIGVGDHGGGPTERQIQWCRDHQDVFDGCRLTFSSPSRFFDAVEREGAELPVVTGELQHHAVGCYSVMRQVKVAVRRAEEALRAAEIVAAADPAPAPDTAARLQDAWRQVCFNQFHDTLGGTCLPSAYVHAADQIGAAAACADDIAQFGLRRRLTQAPDNARQRIAVLNASDRAFDGYALLSPWTETRWRRHWRLLSENGDPLAYQLVGEEGATPVRRRILTRLTVPPGQLQLITLDRADRGDRGASASTSRQADWPTIDHLELSGARVDFAPAPSVVLGEFALQPRLELREDPTDTWSHGVDRLGGALIATATWDAARLIDDGPLMRCALQRGVVGGSALTAEWRVYEGEPLVELRLRIHWRAAWQVLKLVLPIALARRTDGVMGGALERDLDGAERPLRDYALLEQRDGPPVGVVCPDVFAMDASPEGARLTLLRSPLMAHHDPTPNDAFPLAPHADQGVHEFRFEFASFAGLSTDWLEQRAAMRHRPLVTADWTAGMAARGDA